MSEEKKKSILKEAERLERAGRYEWAAAYYDDLAKEFDEKYYDKARELRERACSLQVKVTSVDINNMIRQLKESGAYKCTNCGAKLEVDGNSKKCKYCGSPTVNLPDFLKAALH